MCLQSFLKELLYLLHCVLENDVRPEPFSLWLANMMTVPPSPCCWMRPHYVASATVEKQQVAPCQVCWCRRTLPLCHRKRTPLRNVQHPEDVDPTPANEPMFISIPCRPNCAVTKYFQNKSNSGTVCNHCFSDMMGYWSRGRVYSRHDLTMPTSPSAPAVLVTLELSILRHTMANFFGFRNVYESFMTHPQRASSCTNLQVRSLVFREHCHSLWRHVANFVILWRLKCLRQVSTGAPFCHCFVITELILTAIIVSSNSSAFSWGDSRCGDCFPPPLLFQDPLGQWA